MKTTKIKNITQEEYSGKVFNLEVEPNHPTNDDQYYVCADTGIVVHNCHPRDNIALRWLSDSLDLGYDLFGAIMDSREAQARNMAQRLVDLSNERGGIPIVIVGKAYKPMVSYTDGSPSLLVGHYVEELAGPPLYYYDAMTGDTIPDDLGPAVYLLAHDPETTYGSQLDHVERFMLGRSASHSASAHLGVSGLDKQISPGSVLLDPWRKVRVDENSGITVVPYGNTRTQ